MIFSPNLSFKHRNHPKALKAKDFVKPFFKPGSGSPIDRTEVYSLNLITSGTIIKIVFTIVMIINNDV